MSGGLEPEEPFNIEVTDPEGPQDGLSFRLDVIAGEHAGHLRERVVDELIEAGNQENKETLVSRVRLRVEGIEVNYQQAIPPGTHLTVTIVRDDWQDLVVTWGDAELRREWIAMSQRMLPEGVLWGNTAEFSEMVRLVNSLMHGETTRGLDSGRREELGEVLQVQREALAESGASPSSVLDKLRDEFS